MLSPSITPAGEARPVARGLLRPPPAQLPPLQSVKLLDQVRERIRYLHYSRRTEEAKYPSVANPCSLEVSEKFSPE